MEKHLKILILEDNPSRVSDFNKRFFELKESGDIENFDIDHTEYAEECIEFLKNNIYDIIFTDHDLGGEIMVSTGTKNSGSEISRWIKENPEIRGNQGDIIIHSLNPVGADYMKENIPGSIKVPFAWDKSIFHKTFIMR